MNVTPMIDVLLVLIIIFMLITPVPPKGLQANVAREGGSSTTKREEVILTVRENGTVRVDQDLLQKKALAEKLRAIFSNRAQPLVFLRAEGRLELPAGRRGDRCSEGSGVWACGPAYQMSLRNSYSRTGGISYR